MISYDWILIKFNDIIKWLSFSKDGARDYFADPSNIVDSCNILAIAALGIAWITLYVLWLISAAVLHTPLPMFCLGVSMIAYGLSPLCSSLSPFTSLHPPPSPSSSTLCSPFLPPSPSLLLSLLIPKVWWRLTVSFFPRDTEDRGTQRWERKCCCRSNSWVRWPRVLGGKFIWYVQLYLFYSECMSKYFTLQMILLID